MPKSGQAKAYGAVIAQQTPMEPLALILHQAGEPVQMTLKPEATPPCLIRYSRRWTSPLAGREGVRCKKGVWMSFAIRSPFTDKSAA